MLKNLDIDCVTQKSLRRICSEHPLVMFCNTLLLIFTFANKTWNSYETDKDACLKLLNQKAQLIDKDFKIEDRVYSLAKPNAFITAKNLNSNL